MMTGAEEKRGWYLKRGTRQAGPLTSAAVRRLLLEGQLSLQDEVSSDRRRWQPVAAVAEVVPPELRGGEAAAGRERTRRAAKPVPVVAITVSTLLLGAIIGFAFWWGGDIPDGEPDCGAAPAPGVDWRNCRLGRLQAVGARLPGARAQNADLSDGRLAGADLSGAILDYADLRRADLGYALLRSASLRGSDLRGADLTNADLSRADLGFADLSGAVLGGALLEEALLEGARWSDGTECARGSVGSCVPTADR